MTNKQETVIWITGMPCVGKTTVASALVSILRQKGKSVIHLDGDQIRGSMPTTTLGYSRDKRLALSHHYSGLAHLTCLQGHITVVSTVSLFHEIHAKNRELFVKYLEVLLEAPIDVLLARDTRGIYTSTNPIMGMDIPKELPTGSDVLYLDNYKEVDAHTTAESILSEMEFRGYLAVHDAH